MSQYIPIKATSRETATSCDGTAAHGGSPVCRDAFSHPPQQVRASGPVEEAEHEQGAGREHRTGGRHHDLAKGCSAGRLRGLGNG